MNRILILFGLLSFNRCSSSLQSSYDIFIEDGVVLTVSSTFIELDSIEIKEKYSSSPYRPSREFIDTSSSLNLVITYGQNPLTEDGIEERLLSYETRFKNLYPNANWIRAGVETINDLKVGVIETTDSLFYQLIFFTPIEGKQVHFGLRGSIDVISELQPQSNAILNSLKLRRHKP